MKTQYRTLLVSPEQLVALYGCAFVRAAEFSPHLNEAMWTYGIVTPERIRMFLAQIGHESGKLRYVREIWGPTPAQLRYEGRIDLGNTEPGDGKKYMGRGLIQITGRKNYGLMADALGEDFINYPALLENYRWASLSAGEYWNQRDLNHVVDDGDFDLVTRRINGGQTGRADRIALYRAAEEIIA